LENEATAGSLTKSKRNTLASASRLKLKSRITPLKCLMAVWSKLTFLVQHLTPPIPRMIPRTTSTKNL
ncbi:hypothetical protein LTR72_012432, partial [Exophiala xenobiotica]